ncbi:MAG: cell division protein FtsZ, partial [Polaromonas sp.]|nr:cell division protein FtsZ [Polaromonas sp.]
MSTLQISLAILGGLILAIVVAHSTWSARKNLPRRATPDPSAPPPVEPVGGEPSFDTEPERQEPGFDRDSSLDALTAMTVPEKKPGLDALIDVIAPILVDAPVSGEAALAAMPATRRAGSKPFAVEGLNAATDAWETPFAGQRYNAFQAGVQLANRTGALNQIEFSEFVIKAQAFADAIDGQPEFPDMLDEV